MQSVSKSRALTATAIAGAAMALSFGSVPAAAQNAQGGATYRVTLNPLNGSGARGEATLTKHGQQLTVHITASGLEPGGPHISHIHGLSEGGTAVDSRCPTAALDTDGDGFVELAEGAVAYGPILVDFMNVDPDQDGRVDFTTTVQLADNAEVTPLNKRHIVIHGMTVGAVGAGTPGEVNGEPGYKTVLPVLCGEIMNGPNAKGALQFRQPKVRSHH